MKKNLLLIISLLAFPLMVFADAESMSGLVWDDDDLKQTCMSTSNTSCSTSNCEYSECVAIKCVNGKNEHKVLTPFRENFVCSNGNTDPKIGNIIPVPTKTAGAGSDISIESGVGCTLPSEEDSRLESVIDGVWAYATKVYTGIDCTKKSDGTPYGTTPGGNTGGGNTSGGNTSGGNTSGGNSSGGNTSTNQNEVVKPAETGVEDYYIVLGISALILCTSLYFLNKNNLFKNI